jgi:predicted hydrolase (HD superfamily)
VHSVTDIDFTETEERPVHTILADNEFEAVREEMEEYGIRVNITAKQENVPEVERQNRVIKEHARAIIQTFLR